LQFEFKLVAGMKGDGLFHAQAALGRSDAVVEALAAVKAGHEINLTLLWVPLRFKP
jgi:hypothetical protein